MAKTEKNEKIQKVGGVRIIPLSFKIVTIFTVLLLLSNFASNYINLMMNRRELVKLMNQLLIKDLKELYIFASNQHEIFKFTQDYPKAVDNIVQSASRELRLERSAAFGVRENGDILFQASKTGIFTALEDAEALSVIKESRSAGVMEGTLLFRQGGGNYFGVYKYHEEWDCFLIRTEELYEFYRDSWRIFTLISIIIIGITLICTVLGVFLLQHILKYVNIITSEIMRMITSQKLDSVDLGKAPNDDVTFLGMAFNSLVVTVDNLMNIFKRFVTEDVALQAYKDREVRLEGSQKNLTILFTDIKSFTYMTETLGADIINLLNMHYTRAIHHIHSHGGIIGSIIGDALLAVFGTLPDTKENKSHEAIETAYLIQEVAASLRVTMTQRKKELEKANGRLTDAEERIYRAVLLEVGVGIDGGNVFYGNIGSYERMTNTVIGDNVNSSSRLEGLTRVYKVPVICSAEVFKEVQNAGYSDYMFLELDQVQVKGKTEGKRIYWPIPDRMAKEMDAKALEVFQGALRLYYAGEWESAKKAFSNCKLPCAETFLERIMYTECPKDWNGIWTMKSK